MDGLSTGSFTYLAHPDLFRFTGDREIYRKHMRELIRFCRQGNVPLEVNLLGLFCNKHYPGNEFFALAAEEGCSVIMGLDAHAPEHMLKVETEQQLTDLGFKTAAMALRDDSYSIDDPELMGQEKLAIVLGTEGDTVMKPIEEDVDLNLLASALQILSPREKQIITMRFGLDGKTERTQKEVADQLGISQSYISRLEKRIMQRLRREIGREICC